MKKITAVTSIGPTKRLNFIFDRRDKGKCDGGSNSEAQPKVWNETADKKELNPFKHLVEIQTWTK